MAKLHTPPSSGLGSRWGVELESETVK